MGLDTSHDAWHGAYSAFNRWRNYLARAAGYELLHDAGYEYPAFINWDEITPQNIEGVWLTTPEEPLLVIFAHSDCEGQIYPDQAGPLADRLEELLPKLTATEDGGHIGSVAKVTERFINGLRAAVKDNEPVVFA